MAAAGGSTPSAAMYAALCDFMTGMDAAGLTAKMHTVNCLVPPDVPASPVAADLIRAQVPLIQGLGASPWTNMGNNFVAADLTIDGLKGNGSNKALDTTINPSTQLAVNSVGVTEYNLTSSNVDQTDIGAGSGSSLFGIQADTTGNESAFFSWDFTNRVHGANAAWTGFLSANRTSAIAARIYKAKSTVAFASVGADTPVGGARPSDHVVVFARGLAGGAVAYSLRRLSFAAVHSGLTSAEAQSFYNLVQAMRVSLGGGYL